MNGLVERELKLSAPDAFSLARMEPRLDSYVASPVKLARLHTVYYDTDDLRLTRWGCSLRFRAGEGWTLKIPLPRTGDAMYREEHVFPGDPSHVPDAAVDLATAYLRGARPKPVAELRTLRSTRQVMSEDGNDVAEIALDDVRVVEGTNVVRRFRQLEIELAEGAPDDALDALAAVLQQEGAGEPDPIAKDVMALGERAGAPELEIPELDRRSSLADVARAALTNSITKLIRQDALLRLHPDEDAVHDARVAVRRMRSDLRTFLPILDQPWACDLRERMRWLQDGFSAPRDADVLLLRLQRDAADLPDHDREKLDESVAPLRVERDVAYERMRAMLRDERYAAMLQELVDAAKRPPFTAGANETASDRIDEIVGEAWNALRKRVKRLSRPPANRELHRIRIGAKRVRYAAESFIAVAGRPVRQLARAVEDMQTILGDQHDAVVACERLHDFARDAQRAFVAGELAAVEYAAAIEGRGRWRAAWRDAKRAHRRFTG